MTLLEAMGCGLPCVVPDVGNIRDLLVDKHNSIIINKFDNIDSYVSSILELLGNDSLYRHIAENAISDVNNKYSYDQAKDIWEKILLEIVA